MAAPSPNFGAYAERYARHRLSYPQALYDMLLARVGAPRAHAVDVGAGTGQVTRELLARFDRVTAVDPDAAMTALLPADPRLDVVLARAEEADVAAGSVDLVTAGTAFHWMDEHVVCPAAARWLRPGGVFAAFMYDKFATPEAPAVWAVLEAEAALWDAHKDARLKTLTPYEERIAASGAFARVEPFSMMRDWLAEPAALTGFLMTTSFAMACARATGDEAAYAADFAARVANAAKGEPVLVRYPVTGAIGAA